MPCCAYCADQNATFSVIQIRAPSTYFRIPVSDSPTPAARRVTSSQSTLLRRHRQAELPWSEIMSLPPPTEHTKSVSTTRVALAAPHHDSPSRCFATALSPKRFPCVFPAELVFTQIAQALRVELHFNISSTSFERPKSERLHLGTEPDCMRRFIENRERLYANGFRVPV